VEAQNETVTFGIILGLDHGIGFMGGGDRNRNKF
jgi:hypothetical protein